VTKRVKAPTKADDHLKDNDKEARARGFDLDTGSANRD